VATAAGSASLSGVWGGCQHGDGGQDGVEYFAAFLTPSNNSGAKGVAGVTIDDAAGTISIEVHAVGLTPGEVHEQHIHGFADGTPSHLPTIALDTDLDGFIETPEGVAAIGPVILSATASGQVTSAEIAGDFPTADAQGRLDFNQTYRFDLTDSSQAQAFQQLEGQLSGRAFEIHGLQVPTGEGDGTSYEVNGSGGYVAELPVTGGILTASSAAEIASLLHDPGLIG